MTEARASEITRSCPRCGSTERYASGHCAPCSRARSRAWSRAHRKTDLPHGVAGGVATAAKPGALAVAGHIGGLRARESGQLLAAASLGGTAARDRGLLRRTAALGLAARWGLPDASGVWRSRRTGRVLYDPAAWPPDNH